VSAQQPLLDPPCNTIAYRTIRRKDWFDPDNDSHVKVEAFMRRGPREKPDGAHDPGDVDGLSLFDSFHMDMKACIESELSCHGVASLHVGHLRNLGLTVIRDPLDERKLLVTNMPFTNPNNVDQEALLDAVADSSRIACRCKWKRN